MILWFIYNTEWRDIYIYYILCLNITVLFAAVWHFSAVKKAKILLQRSAVENLMLYCCS